MSKKLIRMRAFVDANPQDPFGWYSLAILQKASDPNQALEIFAKIYGEHPSYLPNFFHYAQSLADDAQLDEARVIYTEGIALAQTEGDAHTKEELQAALELL
jgi:tetratricopeptide (TPR) repeat protein